MNEIAQSIAAHVLRGRSPNSLPPLEAEIVKAFLKDDDSVTTIGEWDLFYLLVACALGWEPTVQETNGPYLTECDMHEDESY